MDGGSPGLQPRPQPRSPLSFHAPSQQSAVILLRIHVRRPLLERHHCHIIGVLPDQSADPAVAGELLQFRKQDVGKHGGYAHSIAVTAGRYLFAAVKMRVHQFLNEPRGYKGLVAK